MPTDCDCESAAHHRVTNVSNKFGLPEAYADPGRVKNFRKACRNDFHLISCNMDFVVTSYDQKTQKLTSMKLTGIQT